MKGFTLIELMISITIVVIFLAMITPIFISPKPDKPNNEYSISELQPDNQWNDKYVDIELQGIEYECRIK